jgi:PAS domain S-box-containing protein
MIGIDEQMCICFWNRAASSTLGWTESEVIKKKVETLLVTQSDQLDFNKKIQSLQSAPSSTRLELQAKMKDGTLYPAEFTFFSVVQTNSLVTVFVWIRSIQEEVGMREKISVLTHAIELTPDPIFAKDVDGRYIMTNYWIPTQLKMTREEVLGKNDYQLYPMELAKRLREADQRVVQAGKAIAMDESGVFGKKSVNLVSTKSPLFDSRGYLKGIVGVSRDVTDEKRYQDQLRVSETRFRKLFEEAPIGIGIFSPSRSLLRFNKAWKNLWDFSSLGKEQLAQKGILPAIQGGFSGRGGPIPSFFYDPIDDGKEESSKRIQAYVYPIQLNVGVISEVILMAWDISDQFRTETTFQLLAETGELLATSLDYRATLERIARIAVKWMEGWCQIFTVDETGEIKQEAAAHPNPEKDLTIKDYLKDLPIDPNADYGVARSIRTGESQFVRSLNPEMILKIVRDPYRAQKTIEIGTSAYMSVPMWLSGKTIGGISLGRIQGSYTEYDLFLAHELARRASLAIHNAKLYKDAQSAIQLRDDFLSIASHELKTPLTSLSLQIQSLRRVAERRTFGTLPPEKLIRMFRTSSDQLNSLTELINTLLDVSRITSGRLDLHFEEFDLVDLIQRVMDRFSEQLKEAGIQTSFQSAESILGRWDRLRIEQVISNFLSNAIKYGRGKPIELSVSVERDEAVFSIQDYGIGIPKEDQSRIFNRYERAVSMYRFGGMGLGLYITYEIVRSHGGKISVQSEVGRGAKFTAYLPRHLKSKKDTKAA